MPRYFFHVMDGRAVIDTVGTELADLNELPAAAAMSAKAKLFPPAISLHL